MKRRIVSFILLLSVILVLCSCSNSKKDSYFRITFIDVGQGDSALIECDGYYMLIDAGEESAGEKVCEVLEDKGITQLDILVASHLHEDHIGGMIEVLEHIDLQKSGKVHLTLCNAERSGTQIFGRFERQLTRMGSKITVPAIGDKFSLGSASIEVIDGRAEKNNDSLVLLVTYQDATFLFAGDMEQNQESAICDRYGSDERWDITLLKVAHHGSKTSTSIRFLRLLMPEYAIISVGEGNGSDHPSEQTLSRLEQADVREIYRTDKQGNIVVEVAPNGKDLVITTD